MTDGTDVTGLNYATEGERANLDLYGWDRTAPESQFKVKASDLGGGASGDLTGLLADIAGLEVSHGDLLYVNSTGNIVNLGPGDPGDHLLSGGPDANPEWTAVSAGSGGVGGIFETTPKKPLVANFTLENAGSASITNGTFGILLTMPSASVNVRFVRFTAGLSGSTWDLRIRSSMQTAFISSSIHHGCILLRNSANGRIINFGSSNANIFAQNWSSYTAYASGIFTFGASYGQVGGWKRVVCDGTTLSFYTSANGSDWALVGTVTLAAYIGAVDQVGFGTVLGATSGLTNVDSFDHFELIQ